MTEKIEVEDITDKRENDDSPHAQHNLDVHDPNAYFDFLKKTRDDINKVSPSFCAAKWTQSTILLYSGETHSCHHPSRHKIQLSDIADKLCFRLLPNLVSVSPVTLYLYNSLLLFL